MSVLCFLNPLDFNQICEPSSGLGFFTISLRLKVSHKFFDQEKVTCTMKLLILKLSLFSLSATAFTSPAWAPSRVFSIGTQLSAAVRPDTSSLIQEAMAASKKFGPTSKEARLAWEAVEEMDSSTNQVYVFPTNNLFT
jgi:hypothetical protein